MDLNDDWGRYWGAANGRFNHSTATFDVGCFTCVNADVTVAAAPTGQSIICHEVNVGNESSTSRFRSETVWGGVWVLILEMICKSLNLRCKVHAVTTPSNSSAAEASLDQVLQSVTDGTADVGLSWLLMTASRTANYSTYPSFVSVDYAMLIHRSLLLSNQFSDCTTGSCIAVLETLESSAWIAFSCLILLIFLGLLLSHKLQSSLVAANNPQLQTSIFDQIAQDSAPFPHRVFEVHRISRYLLSTLTFFLMGIWSSFIFQSTVNIMLPSQLTVGPLTTAPFSSLQQLLLSDFVVRSTVGMQEQLLDSKDPLQIQLGRRLVTSIHLDDEFFKSMADTDLSKRVAYLMPKENYGRLAHFTCEYVEILTHVYSSHKTPFWFRRDSQLLAKFMRRLDRIREGNTIPVKTRYFDELYVDYLLRRDGKNRVQCEPSPIATKHTVSRRAVGIADINRTFPICIGTIVVAGFVGLILELFCENRRRRRTFSG
ncbi:hypothetical protein BV898_07574 [Hypsibius exemplaris]|uniref:Ionotropic glutamate receptor C-terminal domain-containing protein n=1 Tax=Hypsibius exemplaris TaxID=2072580 RepID=A0A1W0WT46_HYPEX|nr:hypothetical protein BV898_07574 [Hypsibius exemplaris]